MPEIPLPPEAVTAMCECSHHWFMHAGSGQTAPSRPCHGYTGSATPGPLREPCNCAGFAQWSGPSDSRTGEPVRPLQISTVPASPLPAGAVTAGAKALRRVTLKVPCPEDREITLAVLGAAAPTLRAVERAHIIERIWATQHERWPASGFEVANKLADLLRDEPLPDAGSAIREAERERCVAEIFAYADEKLAPVVGAVYRDAARLLNRGKEDGS